MARSSAKAQLRPAISQLDAAMSLELSAFPSAEAQLASLADDIAYLSHDFDDALRAGLFDITDIAHLPQVDLALARIERRYGTIERGRLTRELVRRLISVFIEDLLRQSAANLGLGARHPDDIRGAVAAVIAFSPEMMADLEILRDFLFTNMWRHFKVNRMTSKAKRVVTDLFNLFMSESNTLPNEWQLQTANRLQPCRTQYGRGSSPTISPR